GGLHDRPRSGEHRTASRTTVDPTVGTIRRCLTAAASGAVARTLGIRLPLRPAAAGTAPTRTEAHASARRDSHCDARHDAAVGQCVCVVLWYERIQFVL